MQRIKAVIAVIVDHSFFALLKETAKEKVVFYPLSGPERNGTPMIGPIEAPIRNEQGPFHDGLRLAPEMRETFNKKCCQFCAMCMVHPLHNAIQRETQTASLTSFFIYNHLSKYRL